MRQFVVRRSFTSRFDHLPPSRNFLLHFQFRFSAEDHLCIIEEGDGAVSQQVRSSYQSPVLSSSRFATQYARESTTLESSRYGRLSSDSAWDMQAATRCGLQARLVHELTRRSFP